MGTIDSTTGSFAPFLVFLILILLILGINKDRKY